MKNWLGTPGALLAELQVKQGREVMACLWWGGLRGLCSLCCPPGSRSLQRPEAWTGWAGVRQPGAPASLVSRPPSLPL